MEAERQTRRSRRGEKSPEAFRTISEVAEEIDVPQHVLRFWESKFSVVKPLKRGGGRRYYRPSDIELIRGIRDLLYTHGFTIKGAQKLLREHGGKIENVRQATGIVPADQTGSAGGTDKGGDSVSAVSSAKDAGAAKLSPVQRHRIENVLQELRDIRRLL